MDKQTTPQRRLSAKSDQRAAGAPGIGVTKTARGARKAPHSVAMGPETLALASSSRGHSSLNDPELVFSFVQGSTRLMGRLLLSHWVDSAVDTSN